MRTTRTTTPSKPKAAAKPARSAKSAKAKVGAKPSADRKEARRPIKNSSGLAQNTNSFTPASAQAISAANAARQAPVMPAQDKFPAPPGNNPPLDYTVKYTDELVKRYPRVLVDGGDMDSHAELETKWVVDLAKIDDFRKKLDALVADPKLLEQVLGKGWKVTPNLKYVGTPMDDHYNDNPKTLSITSDHGVLRNRSVEGDRVNNINFKPDGGQRGATVFDPVIRGEYDLSVKKEVRDDPSLLNDLIGSGEHVDVTRFAPHPFDPSQLKVVSDLQDVRAKYNFDSEDGLGIEASLDNVVKWSSQVFKDSNGKPMEVSFGQLEMEKAHLAFAGNSPTPAAVVTAPSAPSTDDDDPLAYLRNAGPVTLGGTPRIHTPDDLKSPALRQTPDYPQQVEFNKRIAAYLYGTGVEPVQAEQKNYTGFKLAAEKYNDPTLKSLLGLP